MNFDRRIQIEVANQLVKKAEEIVRQVLEEENRLISAEPENRCLCVERMSVIENIALFEDILYSMQGISDNMHIILDDKSYICVLGGQNEFYN